MKMRIFIVALAIIFSWGIFSSDMGDLLFGATAKVKCPSKCPGGECECKGKDCTGGTAVWCGAEIYCQCDNYNDSCRITCILNQY